MPIQQASSPRQREPIVPESGSFAEASPRPGRSAIWEALPKALVPATPPTFHLETPTARYTLSHAQAHGYYGIFRLGIDALRGHALGVKQLHYHADHIEGGPPVPGTVVHSQRRSVIIEELELQARAGALKPAAVVEVGQQIFVVMALMQGDLLQLSAALQADERNAVLWSVFAQVAEHLNICHEAGFIHRDVKLANILWSRQGSAILADYGLAAHHDDHAALARIRGTAFSQPPEALAGLPVTNKLDVWLLGLTLWHLLVPGKQPFKHGYVCDFNQTNDAKYASEIDFARARMPSFLAARRQYLAGVPVTCPTWAPYFEQAHRNNPAAFEFIMRDMFDPDPTARSTAARACAFALKMLHTLPTAEKMRCQQAFARIGRTSHKRARATLEKLAPTRRKSSQAAK